MEQFQLYRSDCDNVLDEANQALSHLDHLRERYVAVSTKTNALHEACEHLLAEQVCVDIFSLREVSTAKHQICQHFFLNRPNW